MLRKLYNIKSGIEDESFVFMLKDFAARNNIEFYFSISSTAIMHGSEHDYDLVRKEHGDRFSYAICDKNHLDKVLNVCGEYFLETSEDKEHRRIEAVYLVSSLS